MTTIGLDDTPRLSEEFFICNCGTLSNDPKHFSVYGHDQIENMFILNPITPHRLDRARETAAYKAWLYRDKQWELSRVKAHRKFERVPDYMVKEAKAGNMMGAALIVSCGIFGLMGVLMILKGMGII